MPGLRELRFKHPNGSIVGQDVPESLNQSLMAGVCFSNYEVLAVSTSRPLPESAISTVKHDKNRIGFLIPGQAILSSAQPMNSNAAFAAFSLIVACKVCADSFKGNYELASLELMTTNPSSIPFLEGDAYLVVSRKDFPSFSVFWNKYYASLFENRIYGPRRSRPYCDAKGEIPPQSITIREAKVPSEYATAVLKDLYPYATDPILKFFYAYQILELLIGLKFKNTSEEIRAKLNSAAPVSIGTMKDIVNEFQESSKELPRIKDLLTPACGETDLLLDSFFVAINEKLPGKTFGEKVYKARNVLFHEYSKAHLHTGKIAPLSDGLMRHLARRLVSHRA